MDEKTSTFGLSPEKLASLLKIGKEPVEEKSPRDEGQTRKDLLLDRLAGVLPLDPAVIDSLPQILKHLYQELLPLAGESLGDLVQNPKSDLSIIKKIKEYAKKLVTSAKSEEEHDAAIVIYYAAIANALMFHDEKITDFSYLELNKAFTQLVEKPWVPQDLVGFFIQANKKCMEKAETSEYNKNDLES